jgi:hypothetical protein
MANGVHVPHAADIWATGDCPGPTGQWAEVLFGEVRDHGGNVLFSGTPDECVAVCKSWRGGPVRLVPAQWRRVDAEFVDAGVLWQMVTNPSEGGE